MTKILVTGGARSGKSRYAESLLADCKRVDYVATSARNINDPDWQARIAKHVARRPPHWNTIETVDVAGILRTSGPPVLVDCLSLWLTRMADEIDVWSDPIAAEPKIFATISTLCDGLAHTSRQTVLVTNEIGLGIVPQSSSSRAFRDWLGLLNASIAEVCDEVVLCVAGRVLKLPNADEMKVTNG